MSNSTDDASFFFIHSLLPKVYKVDIPSKSPCSMLALEAVRLGAVIVTVVHLLALAINHYIGIARPLHYAGISFQPYVIWSIDIYALVSRGTFDD